MNFETICVGENTIMVAIIIITSRVLHFHQRHQNKSYSYQVIVIIIAIIIITIIVIITAIVIITDVNFANTLGVFDIAINHIDCRYTDTF